jgi:hypothetical protein
MDTKTTVLSPAGPEHNGHAVELANNPNSGVTAGNVTSGAQPPLLPVTAPPAPHPAAGQWSARHSPTVGWQGGPHSPDAGRHAVQNAAKLAGNGQQLAGTGNSGDAVLEMPRR